MTGTREFAPRHDQLEQQLASSGAEVQELGARVAEIEGREQALIAREADLKRRESELDTSDEMRARLAEIEGA